MEKEHTELMPTSNKKLVKKRTVVSSEKINYRHELKYYITYADYLMLKSCMRALLHMDENCAEKGCYHVRSLYFDDRDESALADKLSGVAQRAKYRIRIYDYSPKFIRLEKKIKSGMFIAKKSMRLSRRDYEHIVSMEPEFLLNRPESIAKDFYSEITLRQLSPRVIVDYTREAFMLNCENVRITFDKDLKSGKGCYSIFDASIPVVPILDRGMVVLEVKFDKYLPDYIKGVLNNLRAPRYSAISKYVLCRKYD